MKSIVNTSRSRIPELDGIRGLAIALVLFHHYIYVSILPGSSRLGDFIIHTCTLGGTGVDLFFVLSGFLIGGILMDHRKSEHYFKLFYLRRICRILPAYFLLLASYALARAFLASHSSQSWHTVLFASGVPLWTYVIFTQSIFMTLWHGTAWTVAGWLAPTWSLVLEEQFYLLLPAIIWLLRPSWILPLCLACVCLHPILYFFLWMYHPVSYIYLNLTFPVRVDALLLGVIGVYLVRRDPSGDWFPKSRSVLCILLVLLIIVVGSFAPKFYSPGYDVARDLFVYPLIGFLYTCFLLLAVTHQAGMIARAMRFAPLRQLGMIAYGVYLFHQPVNGLFHGLVLGKESCLGGLADNLATLAALFLTLLFAGVSWHFFEKPIIAWGHSFLYGLRQTPVAGKNPTSVEISG